MMERKLKIHRRVLAPDMQVGREIPARLRFANDTIDGRAQKTFSQAYAERYNQLLSRMDGRRLNKAIADAGSFWFIAWVNAGNPICRISLYPLINKMKRIFVLILKKHDYKVIHVITMYLTLFLALVFILFRFVAPQLR